MNPVDLHRAAHPELPRFAALRRLSLAVAPFLLGCIASCGPPGGTTTDEPGIEAESAPRDGARWLKYPVPSPSATEFVPGSEQCRVIVLDDATDAPIAGAEIIAAQIQSSWGGNGFHHEFTVEPVSGTTDRSGGSSLLLDVRHRYYRVTVSVPSGYAPQSHFCQLLRPIADVETWATLTLRLRRAVSLDCIVPPDADGREIVAVHAISWVAGLDATGALTFEQYLEGLSDRRIVTWTSAVEGEGPHAERTATLQNVPVDHDLALVIEMENGWGVDATPLRVTRDRVDSNEHDDVAKPPPHRVQWQPLSGW